MATDWIAKMSRGEHNISGEKVLPKVRVPTLSPSLNWALGGGLYKGYSLCLYGPEGSGKSLIALMGCGSIQAMDPEALVAYITTEMRPVTPERARNLGVDPARTLFRQANTTKDVFDWIVSKDERFVNSDGTTDGPGLQFALAEGAPYRAIVIDSIKGIQAPKEQVKETVEAYTIGDLSRVLNPAFRSLTPVIRKYDLMHIGVQQVNQNMDADEVKYQNKKYTVPSGQALRHFYETMALVERVTSKDSKSFDPEMAMINDKQLQTGHTIRVRVEKANLDKPFRDAEFKIDYDKGVVDIGIEVAMLAASLNVLKHPLNPEGKPIMTQWVFDPEDKSVAPKKWIGFQRASDEISENLDLQMALLRACNKI